MLLPGNAVYHLLEPFYNAANEAVREVDDEKIIFWEPVTYAYFVNVCRKFLLIILLLPSVVGSQHHLGHQLQDLRTYRERSELGKPRSPGPGFSSVPEGDEYLNR